MFNHARALLALTGAQLDYSLYNDFDSYYFTITIFIGKGLYAESRRALSRAYTLIKLIL